jgi:O-antigen ligase
LTIWDLVPIVIVLLCSVAIAIARRPVSASIGMYSLLIPFDSVFVPGQMGKYHLHLTWMIGTATALILIVVVLLRRSVVRPPRTALWLTLIVLWAVSSSYWAINKEHALFRLPFIGLLLLLYIVSVSIPITKREVATIACLTILGGCFAAAASLRGFSQGEWAQSKAVPGRQQSVAVEQQTSGRETLALQGSTTNPNTLGASLILPLSLCIGQVLASRRRLTRALFAAFSGVIATGLCATMSRGAMMGAVVMLFVYVARSNYARRRIFMLVPIFIGIVLLMPQLFFSRLAESVVSRGAGRLDIWVVGVEAFRHYPILGAGLNCFPDAFNEYAHTGTNFVGFSRAPHNIYLSIAVELGAVGFVLLMIVIASHVRLSTRAYQRKLDRTSRLQVVSLEASCWALLVCGFFLDAFWEEYFWFALMLLAMVVRAREPNRHRLASAWIRDYGYDQACGTAPLAFPESHVPFA